MLELGLVSLCFSQFWLGAANMPSSLPRNGLTGRDGQVGALSGGQAAPIPKILRSAANTRDLFSVLHLKNRVQKLRLNGYWRV